MGRTKTVGVPDNKEIDGISEKYKVRIMRQNAGLKSEQEDTSKGNVIVVGYLGEGSSLRINSQWDTALEGLTVAEYMPVAGAVMQAQTGNSSKSTANTTKIWESTSAIDLNLILHFVAYNDPKNEVDAACEQLLKMASPSLSGSLSPGLVPPHLTIDIGEKLMIRYCVIEDVSIQLDPPRTQSGHMSSNTAQLTISRTFTTNARDVKLGEMGGVEQKPVDEALNQLKSFGQTIASKVGFGQ